MAFRDRAAINAWVAQIDSEEHDATYLFPYPQKEEILDTRRRATEKVCVGRHGALTPESTVISSTTRLRSAGIRKRSSSMDGHDLSETPKKRPRLESGGQDDAEETPRPILGRQSSTNQDVFRLLNPPVPLPPSEATSRTSTKSASRVSARSSPTKQLAAMNVSLEGRVNIGILSTRDTRLPSALMDLLLEFEDCSNGNGVIHSDHRSEINILSTHDPGLKAIRNYMYLPGEEREQLGSTISVSEAVRIVENATMAQAMQQNEAGWNMMVHFPMLIQAIPMSNTRDSLVGVAPITTAKIIKEYLASDGNRRMVDFALYIDPIADAGRTISPAGPAIITTSNINPFKQISTERSTAGSMAKSTITIAAAASPTANRPPAPMPAPAPAPASLPPPPHSLDEPTIEDRILELRRILPEYALNHTDFPALWDKPLAISIETKKRGSDQAAYAELQLGTWHAAQWRFLEDMVSRAGGSFDDLPFLPGLIVNGHDWSLVATTRVHRGLGCPGATTLWAEKEFGSTRSVLGVYKVLWGLQRLRKWVEVVFWPWYRRNALGLGKF